MKLTRRMEFMIESSIDSLLWTAAACCRFGAGSLLPNAKHKGQEVRKELSVVVCTGL
jgi:hypothetical protein